jgi:D-glycero-D-manno-heptose 1,7-bisphosphate phosphatase
MPTNRAVFFDRDGVVNTRIVGGYVRHWKEFELNPGVAAVLKAIKQRGYKAIIITNQRGVGLGLMTEADLHFIHEQLPDTVLQSAGMQFDDILYCTDTDKSSPRRKPSPAMLLEAADKWDLDLTNSWMIGDSMSDIEAGNRAGTKTAYLVTSHSEEIPKATKILHNLHDILKFL